MRQLKFRVWDGEQMISPDYIGRDGVAHWSENSIPQRSDRIMESIGVKDRRGTLIYEGDIVEVTMDDRQKCLVHISDIRSIDPLIHKRKGFTGKIVGNVFATPALLGDGEAYSFVK